MFERPFGVAYLKEGRVVSESFTSKAAWTRTREFCKVLGYFVLVLWDNTETERT